MGVNSSALFIRAILEATTKRASCSHQTTTQQQQARGFGNFSLRRTGKPAETPLVNVREGCVAKGLDGYAVDDGAFESFNTKEVLAVRVYSEDLVEDLSADQRVVHRKLDLVRWRQTVGDVDVENQLGERGAVFQLDGDVREGRVACAADENCLAAADAEVAAAGSRSEIDDKPCAGAVEVALDDEAGMSQCGIIE